MQPQALHACVLDFYSPHIVQVLDSAVSTCTSRNELAPPLPIPNLPTPVSINPSEVVAEALPDRGAASHTASSTHLSPRQTHVASSEKESATISDVRFLEQLYENADEWGFMGGWHDAEARTDQQQEHGVVLPGSVIWRGMSVSESKPDLCNVAEEAGLGQKDKQNGSTKMQSTAVQQGQQQEWQQQQHIFDASSHWVSHSLGESFQFQSECLYTCSNIYVQAMMACI